MADQFSYPPIEPTTFDLIVVGTGLPESIIAAAASSVGKSVLHLDPYHLYGSHYASLSLDDFTSFLLHHSQFNPSAQSADGNDASSSDFTTVPLTTRPMYTDIEITSNSTEPQEQSRKFNLDLCGPRILFCADSIVDLMLKSGSSQYMEFKSIDASFVFDGDGKLRTVPDSRSAIFKDRTLGFTEKNQLMSFYKVVQEHYKAVHSESVEERDESKRISEEDLESPFVEFLDKLKLPPKIKSIILYAIAMENHDQEKAEVCTDVLKTKDGIDHLALYNSSIGRFPDASGAMIFPLYGQGELAQAFCRRAAVKGCLYVLRMAVNDLLFDKSNGSYKGIKLASGQVLLSHQLVLDPSFTAPMCVDSFPDILEDNSQVFGMKDVKGKVARGICITKGSLKPDTLNILALYPPRSLCSDQVTSIRVLQLGSNLAVCPPGMFVFYISTLCDDAIQGKKLLDTAINALFTTRAPGTSENFASEEKTENTEVKPTLLWSALYIQELTLDSWETADSTPMPDGDLSFSNVLNLTMKLFQKMYPQEEFFPQASCDNLEDNAKQDVES